MIECLHMAYTTRTCLFIHMTLYVIVSCFQAVWWLLLSRDPATDAYILAPGAQYHLWPRVLPQVITTHFIMRSIVINPGLGDNIDLEIKLETALGSPRNIRVL